MSLNQKLSQATKTPTKLPTRLPTQKLNSSSSLSSDSNKKDESKPPILKRSGTYIVDSPSIHTTNSNENKTKTVSSKPAVNQPARTQPTISRQLSNTSQKNENTDSTNSSNTKPAKTAISLSVLKQQKRAEMQKLNNKKLNDSPDSNEISAGNNKSIEFILKNARRTGQLNLSDYGLNEVPKSVWNINIEKDDSSFDKEKLSLENDDFKWWDQVELTKLILASNKIKTIGKEIQQLTSLTTLDVHDNQIEIIDEGIGTLNLLQNCNISSNSLTLLPNGICELRHINNLNASNNKLSQLPKNFGHIDDLEDLNLSNNCLNSIPKSFAWLTKIRKLNLSNNSLVNLIPELFYSSNLKIIDLSENQIEEIPEELSELANLEQFYARQNKIKKFPTFKKCCKLKDLDMSFNLILEIDEKIFDNISTIVNFNIRDNKLKILPKAVQVLQNCERLDLSNNDLSGLPFELASIESLKQVLLTGNPLRTIRRDIINRGTEAILKYLRNHLETPANSSLNESSNTEEAILKSEIIKSTKVFDLSSKKLNAITSNMISVCKQSTALVLNASKNLLTDLPDELGILSNQLNELNLSFNMFSTIPRSMFGLSNLSILDLRANKLTTLPNEMNKLTALRELIIADNKFTDIPQCVYELPILENLFANNNQIKLIDADKIIKMKFLSTLNLQNNDLMQIPPELGKAEQIKYLQLEGNPFKIPRTQILAKGTLAILEYLRSRLTES